MYSSGLVYLKVVYNMMAAACCLLRCLLELIVAAGSYIPGAWHIRVRRVCSLLSICTLLDGSYSCVLLAAAWVDLFVREKRMLTLSSPTAIYFVYITTACFTCGSIVYIYIILLVCDVYDEYEYHTYRTKAFCV